MFDFLRKKNLFTSGLFEGLVDMHSHLLPGVDDGIPVMEQTLEALDCYERWGVKTVVLTPHVMEDLPMNRADFLQQRFEALRKSYNGNIELQLGAEYMLDSGFKGHLQSGRMLTVNSNSILVETSYINAPLGFDTTLSEIQHSGFHVILAHPERYNYMGLKEYELLKNRNIRLQLNMLSVGGTYGKSSQEKAKELLRRGWYDYVGTDMHNLRFHLKELERLKLKTSDLDSLGKLLAKNNTE